MANKPLLSIILPTYNRVADYLGKSIHSALSQSFTDFELIVLDDHSTDNTTEFVASIKDKRIRYYKADYNWGEYWLTNYGMNMAEGTFVTWLHSDDLLPDRSLELRIRKLQETPSLDFVHGDIIKIDPADKEIEPLPATDITDNNLYLEYVHKLAEGEMAYRIHHTTVMMKRSFFYRAGPFDCSLPFAGDIDWLIRAIRIGSFARIPAPLYLYRKHNNARTVTDLKEGVDKILIRKMISSRYL